MQLILNLYFTMHIPESPEDNDPVILLMLLNAPNIVLRNKLSAPYTRPIPPSSGPLTKPVSGFSNKS